ncbi:MAG: F0F1 ATP synthase subunit B [Agathobacter sp.]|nr:F0F1 ATP synthase subunit B [Agathobacter sp.]
MAVAIFVLFLIASNLLFNPARQLLKDRQDRIAKDISDAKEASESAAAMKAEYESKLKNIEKQAEAILSEARQKALKNEQRIIDEAKEEARRIIKHAQEEALLEQKRAMDDVKKEIVTVASLMAQKVVSASIDAEIQDTLVEETLKEMGDSTWLS